METEIAAKSLRPEEADALTKQAFIEFVLSAGEVNAHSLPDLVDRAYRLVILSANGQTVGTGALKRPNDAYKRRSFEKAGADLDPETFQAELGWVHVAENLRGKGLAKCIVARCVASAQGPNIFATTRKDSMRHVLRLAGFVQCGRSYRSQENDGDLTLHARQS